jgi:hypothetical protein
MHLLRIITGATTNCRSATIYKEYNKATLKTRIYLRTLQQFHKIHVRQAPIYLINILASFKNMGIYGLRLINNYRQPLSRTNSYANSFFPRAIRLWNKLPNEIKCIESTTIFKTKLSNLNKPHIPKTRTKNNMDSCNPNFKYFGKRWCNIHHARLRMNCSQLNSDLYNVLHVIDNPACRCGHPNETAAHFFLECPLFRNEREILLNNPPLNDTMSTNIILYGSPVHTDSENKAICLLVHDFIKNSKRFH